ncbi:MAG TPA: hypothetical protein VGI75_12015, partial [Pirellulales bacterium]
IPITIDADALLNLGQSAAVPVTVRLSDTTVAEALKSALDPLKLGYQVRDGQLIIGYPQQDGLRQVRYAVTDLASDAAALQELAALVRRMVAPSSWQQSGGKGTIVAANGALLVNQDESAHAAILNFCEKLRTARGLPLKSHLDPARFTLLTREDRAHALLSQTMSANFATPQPISTVAWWLHQKLGASFVVDRQSLAADEISDESDCVGMVIAKPLSTLLDDLTGSAGLTWRAIDEKTVEITTAASATQQMDVEFYPVAGLAADDQSSNKLIAEIETKLAAKAWGNAADQAVIRYDMPSNMLIVRAPQRLEAHIEAYLAEQRSSRN